MRKILKLDNKKPPRPNRLVDFDWLHYHPSVVWNYARWIPSDLTRVLHAPWNATQMGFVELERVVGKRNKNAVWPGPEVRGTGSESWEGERERERAKCIKKGERCRAAAVEEEKQNRSWRMWLCSVSFFSKQPLFLVSPTASPLSPCVNTPVVQIAIDAEFHQQGRTECCELIISEVWSWKFSGLRASVVLGYGCGSGGPGFLGGVGSGGCPAPAERDASQGRRLGVPEGWRRWYSLSLHSFL